MNKELVILTTDDILKSGVSGIKEKDLPDMLQGQISKLKELDKSVRIAMGAADKAKKYAISASNKSAGFGKKKVAIEELQSAGIELAGAVELSIEAQKTSFDFQTKLAEISKYLFGLGVSNIASNRFVVRQLELKLKGASQAELSELARQELISVVKQLKEQEDVLKKQENLTKIMKNHEERLKYQSQRIYEIDEQLQVQVEIDTQHSEQLSIHTKTSKRLEEQLKTQAELDMLLSEKLQSHAEINKYHSEQLKVQAEFTRMQAQQLEIQFENVKMHNEQLIVLQEKNNDLTVQLKCASNTIDAQEININKLKDELTSLRILIDSKANNLISKITLAIATIACILSAFHFFS